PYWLSAPVIDNSVPIRSAGFAAGVNNPPSTAAARTTTTTTMTATTIHNALLFGAGVGAAPEEDDCSSIVTPGHLRGHGLKRSGVPPWRRAFWCISRTAEGDCLDYCHRSYKWFA